MRAAEVDAVGRALRGHDLPSAIRLGVRSSLRHPWLFAAFLVATLSQGLFQGALVWALREVLLRIDALGADGATALAVGAATILALWGLRAAATLCGELASARLAHHVEMDGVRALFAKLLSLPVRFFEKSNQGDLVIAAYQDMRGVRTVTLHLASVVGALSRLLGLGAIVWVMSPKLAVIGLVVVPLAAVPAHLLGRRITSAAHGERQSFTSFYDNFMQVVAGIRVIKVNRGEAAVTRRTEADTQAVFQHLVHQARNRSIAQFCLEAVSGVGMIAVLVVGGQDVAAGRLEWQTLMSILVAIMAVHGPITTLLSVYNSVRAVMPNLDRVRAIMELPSDMADRPDARPLPAAPSIIQLDGLTFGYDDTPVLHDVSATFYRGETIGIVGPSGAGKSTLLSLLLRLYDPSAGRVLLDGVDLRDVRHADLLALCAIVLQEPFLFLDTLANNIRAGRPEATLEEVMAAARAANVHDEIMAMPAGYETVVGRSVDGRGISVGQKQRVCIAAALLRNAPILLFDEATSNLDSVSERAVQGAVERLMAGRTTFIIAHRLSTLRAVDRILVLEDGRIVGLAPHEELLATCPTYRRLWLAQSHEEAHVEPGPTYAALPVGPPTEMIR